MVLVGSTLLVSHHCECVHSVLHDITDIKCYYYLVLMIFTASFQVNCPFVYYFTQLN